MRHHLQRPEVKKKAQQMRKANALVRKFADSGLISRTWNILVLDSLVTGEEVIVSVSAPLKEMNLFVKHFKLRNKMTRTLHTVSEPKEFWGTISINVRG